MIDQSRNAAADADMAEPLGPKETIETGISSCPNGKRKADDELERPTKRSTPASESQEPTISEAGTEQNGEVYGNEDKPLSKNQLKRLRRKQQWEEYKQDRRAKRKDKRHERQARKREEKEARIAEAKAAGVDPATVLPQKEPWKYRPVPVSFIIDCDFEQYMREQELVSLSSQLVRSYAMNRKAKYQAGLHFSSWKGKLKERFETVLKNAHHNWKNVSFHEGNFKEAAKQAHAQMTGPDGGEVIDLIRPSEGRQDISPDNDDDGGINPTTETEAEDEGVDQSVVYLTSESPYTLERLEANTSYVIGGIVDKNREKGLCYKRAKEFKVRTAKLPIGEYMAMQSRFVLTTNQVVEIMAKWLECGNWGQAFLEVIPKRKGGTLKGDASNSSVGKDRNDEEENNGVQDGTQQGEPLVED
ncbi:guanine-1-methyltransferase-domain-containing protein [Corynascus similis CBS 632.67]